VARGNRTAWIIADMPVGSYQESPEQGLRNAVRLMQAGAHMVKVEGGGWTVPMVRVLVQRGIPVCGHLGFTPQSVNMLGGYRIQGREEAAVATMRAQAKELVAAGADCLVLELMPAAVARAVTQELAVPTIGIGAGAGCSGQVLVLHDMLGMSGGVTPRFVRNFLAQSGGIEAAVCQYVADVKGGRFPDDAVHGY
jgi:3-methyl-2-oxobutanoate hydroxymethyltransferase